MTNSEQLLRLVTNGHDADDLIARALDAIREDKDCTLLTAVLTVASTHLAGACTREIDTATKLVAKGSDVRRPMLAALAAECSAIPEGAAINVHVVAGNVWPTGIDTSLLFPDAEYLCGDVTVGAQWIIDRAPVIRRNIRRARAARGRAKKS